MLVDLTEKQMRDAGLWPLKGRISDKAMKQAGDELQAVVDGAALALEDNAEAYRVKYAIKTGRRMSQFVVERDAPCRTKVVTIYGHGVTWAESDAANEHFDNLLKAAEGVLENWASGDLAGAVQALSRAVDAATAAVK